MAISSLLTKWLYQLSEKGYDRTFSAYRFWIELGAIHGGVPKDKLYNDILNSTRPELIQATCTEVVAQNNERPDWVNPFAGQSVSNKFKPEDEGVFSGNLIHDGVPLLLRFITDAEKDPVLSTYAIGLHDRWCRRSLEEFFKQSLSYQPENSSYVSSRDFCQFYTNVNLIAHWVNLGYVQLEDVRDRILRSFTFQLAIYPHQLNSLMILLKISGAAFAAYVDPPIMARCRDLLRYNLERGGSGGRVAVKLAKVGVHNS